MSRIALRNSGTSRLWASASSSVKCGPDGHLPGSGGSVIQRKPRTCCRTVLSNHQSPPHPGGQGSHWGGQAPIWVMGKRPCPPPITGRQEHTSICPQGTSKDSSLGRSDSHSKRPGPVTCAALKAAYRIMAAASRGKHDRAASQRAKESAEALSLPQTEGRCPHVGTAVRAWTRGPPPTLKSASSPARRPVTAAAPDRLSPAQGQGQCTPQGCGPLRAPVRKTGSTGLREGRGISGRVTEPGSPAGHPILQAETGSHHLLQGEESPASPSEDTQGRRFSVNILTWNIKQRKDLCLPYIVFFCRDSENPKITPLR